MSTTTGTVVPTWTLGDRLRKAREWADIKQEEMARRLAKSRGAISGWEGDQHRPDVLAIRAWAHETNVPVWWLLDEDDEHTPDGGLTGGSTPLARVISLPLAA